MAKVTLSEYRASIGQFRDLTDSNLLRLGSGYKLSKTTRIILFLLLVIHGIERNPGPNSPDGERKNEANQPSTSCGAPREPGCGETYPLRRDTDQRYSGNQPNSPFIPNPTFHIKQNRSLRQSAGEPLDLSMKSSGTSAKPLDLSMRKRKQRYCTSPHQQSKTTIHHHIPAKRECFMSQNAYHQQKNLAYTLQQQKCRMERASGVNLGPHSSIHRIQQNEQPQTPTSSDLAGPTEPGVPRMAGSTDQTCQDKGPSSSKPQNENQISMNLPRTDSSHVSDHQMGSAGISSRASAQNNQNTREESSSRPQSQSLEQHLNTSTMEPNLQQQIQATSDSSCPLDPKVLSIPTSTDSNNQEQSFSRAQNEEQTPIEQSPNNELSAQSHTLTVEVAQSAAQSHTLTVEVSITSVQTMDQKRVRPDKTTIPRNVRQSKVGQRNARSVKSPSTQRSAQQKNDARYKEQSSSRRQKSSEVTRMNIQHLALKGVLTDVYDCIQFLREHRLLAKEMDCPKCALSMGEEITKANEDGYRWRCENPCCKTTTTIRKGSFFERSNVGLIELILITYFWALDVSQQQIAHESEVSERTIVDWASFLREACSSDLIRKKRQIGGPGHVVSIDKTQVARQKWCTNAQGRPVKSQWLFGGKDHSTKEVFIELVTEPGRTAPVMEELITRHIARGTVIWSDMFASHRKIEELGKDYTHRLVNHSREYNTDDRIHTNNMESLWADIKPKFKRMKGVAHHLLPSYLREWLWRRQYPGERHFSEILRAIATNPKYDVTGRIDYHY